MNRLAVVVLNWNGIEDTLACIDSLMQQTINFTLIIVDNASHDHSKEKLEKFKNTHPKEKVVVIYNTQNKGFTGGVNTGISWALDHDYEAIALFNNDAVADKKWLENLVKASGHEKIGITTGLLLHADGKTIDSTGEQYSKWGLPFPRNRKDPTTKAEEEGYTFGATGGASLYKAALFKDIGLFDEDIFAYYEDVDISFRAQLAGWKIFYTPTAIAYHKQGASSSKVPGFTVYQMFKNLPIVLIKNVPLRLYFSVAPRFYIAYWLMFFNAVVHRSGRIAIKGVLAGIWLAPKKIVQRWRVQRTKRVSSSYIKSLFWDDLPPLQAGLKKLRAVFIGKSKML